MMQGRRGVAARSGEPAESAGRGTKPDLLARLMGLYILVAVGRIGDLVPWLHNIPLAKLLVFIAIIVAMRGGRPSTAVTWKSVPPAKLTIAVMGVTTVSILWSVLRSATLGVVTGTALAVTITLILVIKAARNWESVKTILHGVVFSSIVLIASVFTTKVHDAGGARAGYSSSYDPNDFAFVLLGFLPLVITFGIVSRGAKRLIYFGLAGFVTIAILLTESRGGLFGLIFDVVAMTFLLPVARRGQLRFQVSKWGIVARTALLILIALVAWQSLPEKARARFDTITTLGSDYNSNISEGGRLAIWTRNLPSVLNRPWGYGAGAFEAVDGMYSGGRYRAAHNTLLQASIELGIPGLLLLVSTIVASLRYLRVAQDRDRDNTMSAAQDEPRAFARGLGIGWVGLCISGFFLSELYSNVLWTFVTLSCAVGIVRRLPTTTPVTAIATQAAAENQRAFSARAIAKPTR
jgi:hypothetical protein